MLSLFSGVGMIDLAASWAGIETVAFCEIEEYPQKILQRRFPGVPIYRDIRELTAEKLKADGISKIDIIKGSNSAKHLSTGHHINQLANKVKLNKTEGQLNADWVELLMGLPIGWTDINVAKEDIESWQGWPAAINVEQYAYEPPRVIVGQKNRAKRLKALGNGCVPQQVYLVLAAIVEVENEA